MLHFSKALNFLLKGLVNKQISLPESTKVRDRYVASLNAKIN